MSRPRPAKADTTPTRRAFVPLGREVTVQRRRRLDHPAHDGQGYVLVEYHGSEDGKPFQVGAALFLFNARSRGYAARMARKIGVNLLPESYCQIWCTGGCSCGGSPALERADHLVAHLSHRQLRHGSRIQ